MIDTPVRQRLSQVMSRTPPPWSIPEILWIALIAAVAFQLRTIDYPLRPALSNNWDEFAFAWSGLTLITRGIPYGWSFLPHYAVVTPFMSNGITFPLVHPYLDHPPLFSLLVGAQAWLFGARDLGDVTTAMTRPLAITLGTLSVLLMYALARRVLPTGAAVIGTVLFATAPVSVLLGRVAESEALLSPLLLLALLLVARVLSGEAGRWTMAVIATCCTAATLTKVPGLATGLACAAILKVGGRSRLALYPLGGAVAGLALYVGYGWLIDWKQFLAVISDQAARREGVLGAYEFVASPAGIGGTLRDGWWLLGWAGLAALGLRYRQGLQMVLWPVLTVTLVILLLGGESLVARYGWYRIYIYPLVYLGAGYACWEAVRTAAVGWVAAVLMLGAATTVSLAVGYGIAGSGPPAAAVATVALLVLGSALVAESRRQNPWLKRVAQGVAAGVVALALVGNVLESSVVLSLKQPF